MFNQKERKNANEDGDLLEVEAHGKVAANLPFMKKMAENSFTQNC